VFKGKLMQLVSLQEWVFGNGRVLQDQ